MLKKLFNSKSVYWLDDYIDENIDIMFKDKGLI